MTRFQRFIKQVEEGDKGFTLIELMVVVLIIGILMAIAIPTFLSAKNGANAKAAQANARNVYTDEASLYSTNQAYDGTVADLKAAEANITIAGTPAANGTWNANEVYVSTAPTTSTPPGSAVLLTSPGKDSNCYSIEAIDGTVYYGTSKFTGGACAAVTTWDTSWGGSAAASQPASLTWTPAA